MSKNFKKFITCYNTYFEKVYRYIFFRVGREKDLAQDLTSEIFLKALEKFEDFDNSKSFGVWIYRIAHNHLVDYYKKVKAQIVPLEDMVNEIKTLDNCDKNLDIKMNLERVKMVLEKLPELQKEVVLMKYVNDLSTPEIASILDTNEAHVRVLHHRALQALKTNLAFIRS